MSLADKKCSACVGATTPMEVEEAQRFRAELGPEWQIVDGHHLEKEWKFKDFVQALDFTNRAGAIAEAEGHHPDIYLTWGKVRIKTYTHKVNGLTESDFVLAAKLDQLQ